MLALVTTALCLGLTDAAPSAQVKNRRLDKNQTVVAALYAGGLDELTVEAVKGALAASGFDFRRANPGDQLRFVFKGGQLDVLDYRRNVFKEWQVRRDGEKYVGKRRELEREQSVEVIDLTIESSVWDAALAAGEKPEVAIVLSDVFAWDVDFYRDVQRGDRMRAVVEKIVSRGRVLGYGNVLAAEYAGHTVGAKKSYRYRLPDGTESYFLEDGTSARKTFLKTPLKYARLTSGFGSRHHPVLNYARAHNGVDYGTPTGTPVWAVADGTVTRAGWDAGGGNRVCVKHAMSFETCYLHLSKILVREGQRVPQKTVLGESGNTGLSTGPHLHFAMKRGGAWVNPLSQNFPRADPLPKALVDDFKAKVAPLAARLSAAAVAAH